MTKWQRQPVQRHVSPVLRFIALPFSLLSSPSKLAGRDECSLENYCTNSHAQLIVLIRRVGVIFLINAYLKIYVFLWLCRRLCWRSDRVAVCLHLLSPALPTLSAHGLPPALCQSGCCRPHALASPGRPAAHWQCHHPSPGRIDWRASMTSGHHRDFPQHPYQATEPTSPFPVTDWLLYTFQWTVLHLIHLHAVRPRLGDTHILLCLFFFISGSCSAAVKVYI